MTSAREIALDLAANYGIPVFPCKPDKSPATPRGFYDATTDLEKIEQWFKDDTLIGVPTGEPSGLIVVDIDPKGRGWYRENFERLAPGCINTTRREGYHLPYRRTRPVPCSASKVAPGVDIRGDGGYVIWWPATGLPQAGGLDELTPFPDWVVPETKPKPLADDALVPGMYGEGGRNDALSRAAYKMRKAGMTLPEILAALRVTNQQRCVPPLPDEEVVKIVQGKLSVVGESQPITEETPETSVLVFRHISEIIAEKRESEWLVDDIIEQNVLAVLAGPRGTFKSFVALDWSMRIALTGRPVVILSGEGAGLDRRADAWIRTYTPERDPAKFPIYALERALNLNQDLDLLRVKGATEALGETPAMIVVDTFSKFSAGLDENDNGEVSTYLAKLSQVLRDQFGSTVLLVAHSGHAEAGRPRGASALMANPDAEYIITRASPTAMQINVSRERFKDSPAMPPLGYEAKVVDLGRVDKRGRQVTSLALITTEPMVTTPKKEGGRNREAAMVALREFHRANPDSRHLSSQELADILAAQGLKDRRRRPEVIAWLVSIGVLTPSVGGHSFDPTNL